MKKQIIIKVHGLVQGVLFRSSTKEQADLLNLKGYVKNMHDRTVAIAAEGEEENLKKLIAWAKLGPPSAHVDKIETKWQNATGNFRNFEIKY